MTAAQAAQSGVVSFAMSRPAILIVALFAMAPAARGDTTAATAPKPADATAKAPDAYKVKMSTTKGDFVIEVHRDWAPNGADRFYNLVKLGYFTDVAFFRVVKGFMVQLGIHGDPAVSRQWRSATIKDDPTGKQSNKRGMVTFATAGPDMRTTQIFINYGNNSRLDSMGFPPFGKVVDGMKVVDAIEGMYGEGAPEGRGPMQDRIQSQGNAYLKASFPKLDYVKRATIVP
jgi:peptidyl-prolyl cis-trans isomerase A (cyclophilin A)